MQRIMRQQRARDQSSDRAPPAAPELPAPPAAARTAASKLQNSPVATRQTDRQQEETTAANGIGARITALLQARGVAPAAPKEPDEVDILMAQIKEKRIRQQHASEREEGRPAAPNPPIKPTAQMEGAGMGAANTNAGKHVSFHEYKKLRAGDTGTVTRRAPARDDSEDDSDQEVDDSGTVMGPMGDAPIERWSTENRKAAAKFLETIGSVECARRHFKDQAIVGTASAPRMGWRSPLIGRG